MLKMVLAQAQFATGAFGEAAQTTQQAMHALPQEQWGVVPSHYKELYSSIGDYTTQLRALEAAARAAPNDSQLNFLLGFHYLYLGYPSQATRALDKSIAADSGNTPAIDLRAVAAKPADNGALKVPELAAPQ